MRINIDLSERGLRPGEILSGDDVIAWFARRYPLMQLGVACTAAGLSGAAMYVSSGAGHLSRRRRFIHSTFLAAMSSNSPIRDFTRVGRSHIEGTGVFAKRRIPRGTRIFEYVGEHLTLSALLTEAPSGDVEHTYYFRLNESIVIDGSVGGNDSRFINHSCDPNCEAYVFDDRMYIYAMRDIARHEELTFDYQLQSPVAGEIDGDGGHPCRCGSKNCRGTLLAPRANAAAGAVTNSNGDQPLTEERS